MLTLKRYIQRFPGSSLPAEIETTDGLRLVLKMKGAGNGTQSLMAEFIVNRAAVALGWPVPDAVPVLIPEGFPWEFGTDEYDDIVQKSYGINLGLQFLGPCQALDGEAVRKLSPKLLGEMATLDALFLNYDRRGESRNVLHDDKGKDWFIDHGSCQFLDRDLLAKPLALPPGHLLLPEHERIQKNSLLPLWEEAMEACIEVPQGWRDELGWDLSYLTETLEARLEALGLL
jgi:hypothetical protein